MTTYSIDRHQLAARLGIFVAQPRALALHAGGHRVFAERHHRSRGRGLDARRAAQALEDARAACRWLLRRRRSRRAADRSRATTSGSSAKPGSAETPAAAPRTNRPLRTSKRQRQRQLRGDQRAAHGDAASDAAATLAGLILQRRQQIRPRQPQRRPQPERRPWPACRRRRSPAPRACPATRRAAARSAARSRPSTQRLRRPRRRRPCPSDAAGDRQQQALHQQLPDDARSGRRRRRAGWRFLFAAPSRTPASCWRGSGTRSAAPPRPAPAASTNGAHSSRVVLRAGADAQRG